MPSSIIADVTRRATSFWSRRSSRPPSDGVGKHRALQTSEDGPHLDGMVSSPLSAPPSRPNTPGSDQLRAGPYAHTTDPFSDPASSASSLFVNAQPITLDIGASPSSMDDEDPESATASSLSPHPTKKLKAVSAPAPLDLPRPRSPPPRTATPHANRPPEPFPRPDSRMSEHDNEEETPEPVPWWTEWLCGCSEGPDRGGEAQVRPVTSLYSTSTVLSNFYRLAGRTLLNNAVTALFYNES
jgi:hypothetical protein